jgi:thiosulfate reductase cytochrome b subunit
MADSLSIPTSAVVAEAAAIPARHSVLVRVTHWLTTLSFFALLVSGMELVISHPRFYWGEVGNIWVKPLFQIHIPASRSMVNTGYNYTLPDQNGWSRYLHFQSAWILLLTGLLYVVSGLVTRHFRNDLLPEKNTFSWSKLTSSIREHLSFKRPAEAASYNLLQRLTYLAVIFGLIPLAIWTGLAMSPAFVSAFPLTVTILGGTQSARTIHFFVSLALTLFVLVHVFMIVRSGFKRSMKAMTIGTPIGTPADQP